MMKKRLKLAAIMLGAVLFVAFAGLYHVSSSSAMEFFTKFDALKTDTITIKRADGDELLFTVELALTPTQQQKGLMNRTFLADNAGMLFVFGNEERRAFWMKDTLIPLDMLFIDKRGVIQHIHSMAKPLDHTRVVSERPALAVLELNGGATETLGIKKGDVVYYPAFRNVHLEAPLDAPANLSIDPGQGVDENQAPPDTAADETVEGVPLDMTPAHPMEPEPLDEDIQPLIDSLLAH